jgi:hypothetical protein
MFRRLEFFLSPDEGGGAGGNIPGGNVPAGSTGSNVAPGGTPAPGADGSQAGSSPGISGGGTPAGGAPTPISAASAPEFDDIRDVARQYGLDLSQYQDSRAAAQYLIETARDNSAYLQYGRALAPHYSDFQRFLEQRQAGAQPQMQQQQVPQKPVNPFGLPDFDPAWLDMVVRDAQGNLIPKPGTPLDVPAKIMSYYRARQAAQDKLFTNPQDVLVPMLQQAIAPMLQQYFQTNIGQMGQQQFIQGFLGEHGQWIYQVDPQGRSIIDPVSGRKQFTQEGYRLFQHIENAHRMGIQSYQDQAQYAMNMLRMEYQAQGGQQQTQQQQGGSFGDQMQQQLPPPQQQAPNPFASAMAQNNQLKQGFLQAHNRRPSYGGSMQPPNNTNNQVPQNSNLSLREMLAQNLKQAGITDAMIAAGPG